MATTTHCSPDTISKILIELRDSTLAERVLLPNSERYQASVTSYFSQQVQSLLPAVILAPQSAQEVADIVKTIAKHHKLSPAPCFAVKSGGKNPGLGLSNIQAGVTIDLRALNSISVSSDRQTATIGSGAVWDEVYSYLDEHNLGIAGGREPPLGVGGLSLGGGLSFFGPQRGFVCDDIISYKVVLADGSFIEATQTSHADLWRALKGGSNNFGIVTNFVFKVFELGKIWSGGRNVWPITTASQHLDALYDFATDPSPDEYGSVITSFGLNKGRVMINQGLHYMKPVVDPPAFKKFLEIEGRLHSNSAIKSLSTSIIEQGMFNSDGRRQALMTATFINDRDMLQYSVDTFQASIPAVQKLKDVNWNMTFQPLTTAITQKSQESGGNVMGLEGAPPLINTIITVSWDDPKDDDFLVSTALEILRDISETAKTKGKFHRYLYLNYAWPTQDPISGYGEENKKFMQAVSKKYDPNGLFQTGLAGGFKLFK